MTELSPIEVLTSIHQGPESVITFRAKLDGRMQDIASLRADELREKLPFIASHLRTDAYFTINSTYRQEHSRVSPITGCTVYWHKEKQLRWLNCLALDIDAAHKGEAFSFDDLCSRFLTEIHDAALPVPTLVCSSGRGMWALWKLRDHLNGGPVPAHKRPQEWFKRVARAMSRRFAHLGADAKCHDCARITRYPGSRNSAAPIDNQTVRFYRISDVEYSLPEIAPYFGVKPRKIELTPRKKGPRDAAKQAGAYARWSNTLAGFRQLWKLRESFEHGSRHNAVFLYAVLLRYNRHDADEITGQCTKLAASCNPPVPAADIKKCIQSARRVTTRLRHDTFIRMLDITADEIAALPIWFKPYRPKAQRKIQSRRDALAQAITSAERVFSVREAILVLRAKGFNVSRGTVAADLKALRFNSQTAQVSNFRCLKQISLPQGTSTKNWTVEKPDNLTPIPAGVGAERRAGA